MLRTRSVLLAALAAVTVVCLPAGRPAGAASAWVRPVPGPILRAFAAPATPYGPGHRGVDLRAAPDEPVRAVAAGVVTTAGPAGGTLHVVLRLADGSQAGLSFLAEVSVRPGDRVPAGAVLGRAGGSGTAHPVGAVHLSWRVRGVYRDPARRLAPRRYRLVRTGPAPTGGRSGGLG
ncbi:MAG: murein hydrolase activator EnvC family protein [Actinomycetes bacterium]